MRSIALVLGSLGFIVLVASGCSSATDDEVGEVDVAEGEVVGQGTAKIVVTDASAHAIVSAFGSAGAATGGAGSSFVSVAQLACTRGGSCSFDAPGFTEPRMTVSGEAAEGIMTALEGAGVVSVARSYRGGTAPVSRLGARAIDCRVSNSSNQGRCEIVVPDCRATGCGSAGGSCQLCFATWQCVASGRSC